MDLQSLLIPALVAFILNMVFTPVIIKLALKFKWYDHINDRKIHTGNIPRIGGVGIFLSFFISFSLFYFILNKDGSLGYFSTTTDTLDWKLFSFYFSITAIFVTGLIDDFSNIKARYKLIIQIAVSFSLVASGFLFRWIQIPFSSISIDLGLFAYPLSFIWFIGIINAVNLIDGMDGLSGGTSFISLLFFGLVGYFTGNYFMAYISFILMASLLAFLVFNFPPAKIFMGDSGSLFVGTALAIFPLSGQITEASAIIPVSSELINNNLLLISSFILIIPIFDTLSAIVRRTFIKKIHFFNPDKEHMHHKLLDLKLSNKKVLLVIYSVVTTAGITVLLAITFSNYISIVLPTGIIIVLMLFALLSILWNKKA